MLQITSNNTIFNGGEECFTLVLSSRGALPARAHATRLLLVKPDAGVH